MIIKWEQWAPNDGLIRCGHNELKTIMEWMKEFGTEVGDRLKRQDKPHAVYGRKIYGDDGSVKEVRFYTNVYMADKELDDMVAHNPRDLFYVAHKN